MNQNTIPNPRIHQDPEATVPAGVNKPSQSAQTVAHIPLPTSQPTVAHQPIQAPRPPIQMPMPPPLAPVHQQNAMPYPHYHEKKSLWWLWGILGIGVIGISSIMAVVMGIIIIQADARRIDMSRYATPEQAYHQLSTGFRKLRTYMDVSRILVINPLTVRVYDPVTGDSAWWTMPSETWDNWLIAYPDGTMPNGYRFQIIADGVANFLTRQQTQHLDISRKLNITEALTQIQTALDIGAQPLIQVYHNSRQHIVQAGETITSIAWDYGIPYLYIQQVNNGISALSVGQSITIPPADLFIELPPVPNKRIVVSIPEQRVRVYENGVLIWDWLTSTGINSSPTWRGVYQILSHELNAYAGNWNLWMPNFMGVYRPIPGSDFTNGFHGFPTRGGGQLLWENNLGGRVTYGCILLSNTNIQQLYTWAELGVVVEIN